MPPHDEASLGAEATRAGQKQRSASEGSLGDQRTLGGNHSTKDPVSEHIDVVDLEARYRLEQSLGRGGMGEVMLATDTRLGRKVAIKRILGEAANSKSALIRFLTEAKAIAALNHPNIVQIYDYGRAKDGPFLIMEYVDGGNLFERCRDTPLPLEEAVDVACQLCNALAMAHDSGIVHRDIKPANVLVSKDGIPKLTDFGLAKAPVGDHGQTMTGAILGTPDFMPPEQRRDAALVDQRSDLWSLAATVYQMVTGRSPKNIRLDLLPADLMKVLGKALEDAQEDRYQSARELREALRTSILQPAATITEPAGQGHCPACGTHNETKRKFCRNCGGSLEAPCLSCDNPMPMSEEICGVCGAKQTLLVNSQLDEMAADQAQADSLLGQSEFDMAAAIAKKWGTTPHPRLQNLLGWETSFLQRVEEARSQEIKRALEALDEAAKHEADHDYPSAIAVLELAVPESLRDEQLRGARESVASALSRLKKTQAEVVRVESFIKNRLAVKSLDGLLPRVERLLELRPERRDVATLRSQLIERRTRQIVLRDEAIASATAMLAAHNYDGAAAAISKVSPDVVNTESKSIQKRLDEIVPQVRALSHAIRDAVASRHLDGLLDRVEAYLQFRPNDKEILKLRQTLAIREQELARHISDVEEQSRELKRAARFSEAVAIIERIPLERRSPDLVQLAELCSRLSCDRSIAMGALSNASRDTYGDAISAAETYARQLVATDIGDEEFAEALQRVEAACLRDANLQAAGRAAKGMANWLIAGGALLASLIPIVLFGLWMLGIWRPGMITNSVGMQLVRIPAGEYNQRIARASYEPGKENPYYLNKGRFEKPFYIGRTEVTQQEWKKIMDTTPWKGKPRAIDGPRQPVTYVTRADAERFCELLTKRERSAGTLGSDMVYRLPSELEWEYACGARSGSTYHFGNNTGSVARYEWCSLPSGGEDDHPRDVGLKRPTWWGLYDAFGNVREICRDRVRGARWTDPPERCEIQRASSGNAGDGNEYAGFRVVLSSNPP